VGATPPAGVPTKRSTRVNLMLAAVVAVFAVVLLLVLGGDGGGVYVYRAAQNVPARGQLTEKMFEAVKVQDEDIVEGAFTADSKDELAKEVDFSDAKFTRYPIAKGSQLTEGLVSEPTQLPNSTLAPDESLISITATVDYSVAGALKVGDTVDVYAIETGSGQARSSFVLGNAVISAIAPGTDLINSAAQRQATSADAGEEAARDELLPGDPIPGVYTLKVKADSVPRFAVLQDQTTYYLSYRGPGSQTVPYNGPVTLSDAMCTPPLVMPAEGQQAVPPAAPAVPYPGCGIVAVP